MVHSLQRLEEQSNGNVFTFFIVSDAVLDTVEPLLDFDSALNNLGHTLEEPVEVIIGHLSVGNVTLETREGDLFHIIDIPLITLALILKGGVFGNAFHDDFLTANEIVDGLDSGILIKVTQARILLDDATCYVAMDVGGCHNSLGDSHNGLLS